ncbi:N-acetyltransferase [Streptomyces xanthochromogenes]|uniref:GNAT family N-acetyltransferase n=1 Tax=Streptomyces xanthochromogenes TaxID=67384 RepID=UPI00167485DD|nr:GNAT family protein [Streptomyces xanthochromogenes]GHB63921.1 N-acetyltransferase [Streptomyces xanthochromogenes]
MPAPVILSGRSVRLEPLSPTHAPALAAAAAADRTSYAFTPVPHGLDAAYAYVHSAMADQEAGRSLAFATVRAADGLVVGSTRFCELDYWDGPVVWPPAPRGPLTGAADAVPDAAEIGGTWLSAHAQGTGINSEAKLLMFQHAFDTWRVRRISLRADARNARSRAAIERLGAVSEGVRRVHTRGLDGLVRGTAFYSVLDEEWPVVRHTIEQRLARAERSVNGFRLVLA